jgi:CCR4-NOT transcription complex subunit 6
MIYNNFQQVHQHQQTHTQHHQAIQGDHSGHGMTSNVINQHSAYSGGMLANTSPFSTSSVQNGHAGQTTRGGQAQQIPEHWAEQLRLLKDSERANSTMVSNGQPHYWARLKAPENKGLAQSSATNRSSSPPPDSEEERRRPWSIDDESKRQDWQNIDMSGQGLRILSPALFSYTFLAELYIASNKLTSIPPGIGQLRQLRILEASHNNISELPPEIGMCTNMKQLFLFHNDITQLPHELGALYYLETLGIAGNPLQQELKEEIMERGTKSLITMLRESAPSKSPEYPFLPGAFVLLSWIVLTGCV